MGSNVRSALGLDTSRYDAEMEARRQHSETCSCNERAAVPGATIRGQVAWWALCPKWVAERFG